MVGKSFDWYHRFQRESLAVWVGHSSDEAEACYGGAPDEAKACRLPTGKRVILRRISASIALELSTMPIIRRSNFVPLALGRESAVTN